MNMIAPSFLSPKYISPIPNPPKTAGISASNNAKPLLFQPTSVFRSLAVVLSLGISLKQAGQLMLFDGTGSPQWGHLRSMAPTVLLWNIESFAETIYHVKPFAVAIWQNPLQCSS